MHSNLTQYDKPDVCIKKILPALAAAPAKKTNPRKKHISFSLLNISSLFAGSEKIMSISFPIKNGTDIDTVDEINSKPTAPR